MEFIVSRKNAQKKQLSDAVAGTVAFATDLANPTAPINGKLERFWKRSTALTGTGPLPGITSLIFDGKTNCVTIPRITMGPVFSLCFWLKMPAQTTESRFNLQPSDVILADKDYDGILFPCKYLGVFQNKLEFGYFSKTNSGEFLRLNGAKTVADNQWHFICHINPTGITGADIFYVDGVLDTPVKTKASDPYGKFNQMSYFSPSSLNPEFNSAITSFFIYRIGAGNSCTYSGTQYAHNYFKGELATVRFYNTNVAANISAYMTQLSTVANAQSAALFLDFGQLIASTDPGSDFFNPVGTLKPPVASTPGSFTYYSSMGTAVKSYIIPVPTAGQGQMRLPLNPNSYLPDMFLPGKVVAGTTVNVNAITLGPAMDSAINPNVSMTDPFASRNPTFGEVGIELSPNAGFIELGTPVVLRGGFTMEAWIKLSPDAAMPSPFRRNYYPDYTLFSDNLLNEDAQTPSLQFGFTEQNFHLVSTQYSLNSSGNWTSQITHYMTNGIFNTAKNKTLESVLEIPVYGTTLLANDSTTAVFLLKTDQRVMPQFKVGARVLVLNPNFAVPKNYVWGQISVLGPETLTNTLYLTSVTLVNLEFNADPNLGTPASFSYNSNFYVAGSSVIADGQWHHVAVTCSPADRSITFSLDGQVQQSMKSFTTELSSHPVMTPSNSLFLGDANLKPNATVTWIGNGRRLTVTDKNYTQVIIPQSTAFNGVVACVKLWSGIARNPVDMFKTFYVPKYNPNLSFAMTLIPPLTDSQDAAALLAASQCPTTLPANALSCSQGVITCKPGYKAPSCASCDTFHMGLNCACPTDTTLFPNSTCDPVTGITTCKAGFSPPAPLCGCPATLNSNQVCDPLTGIVSCKSGWQGAKCLCPNPLPPEVSSCEDSTGFFQCQMGNFGEYAKPASIYSNYYKSCKCSSSSTDYALSLRMYQPGGHAPTWEEILLQLKPCSETDGRNLCLADKYPVGKYQIGERVELCDFTTGAPTCFFNPATGQLMGEGKECRCPIKQPDGTFGINNPNIASCDLTTGEITCKPGFHGIHCNCPINDPTSPFVNLCDGIHDVTCKSPTATGFDCGCDTPLPAHAVSCSPMVAVETPLKSDYISGNFFIEVETTTNFSVGTLMRVSGDYRTVTKIVPETNRIEWAASEKPLSSRGDKGYFKGMTVLCASKKSVYTCKDGYTGDKCEIPPQSSSSPPPPQNNTPPPPPQNNTPPPPPQNNTPPPPPQNNTPPPPPENNTPPPPSRNSVPPPPPQNNTPPPPPVETPAPKIEEPPAVVEEQVPPPPKVVVAKKATVAPKKGLRDDQVAGIVVGVIAGIGVLAIGGIIFFSKSAFSFASTNVVKGISGQPSSDKK
jgi:hypothetical protein